ncbi:biliverdin-producing heme oxygenase [Myxococcus sp. SDU36]|uniref:biliverdin-producing heme oxygenase n=1 Tax=Myxococcus sp. SDU36 TaxID=2831967 RepID=UPI002542ADDC|nr:biliverdin-producing heme oxygenase [Myxococcus sp. SDU36]WIG99298.1 biliverdin-producing heme oxygenase [Myxococcus sp. SDU36]
MSATGTLRLPRTEVSARVKRWVEPQHPAATPLAQATPPAPLSELLAEGTAKLAEQAERSLFIQSLFFDAWDGGLYGQYVRAQHYVSHLRQLHTLYTAFEAALPHVMSTPLTTALLLPELRLTSALEADLTYFCGESRTDTFACVEARLHAERIREVSEDAPHLLVAHAYARCVLDVFSGHRRARRITDAFELAAGQGTTFYGTVPEAELAAFRVRFHSRLDGLELDEDEAREVVQEARMAFRLHALVCDELARGATGIAAGPHADPR